MPALPTRDHLDELRRLEDISSEADIVIPEHGSGCARRKQFLSLPLEQREAAKGSEKVACRIRI